MINYNTSKIYKIVCNNTNLTYYGSTTRPLCQRIAKHKQKKCKYNCTSRKIIDGGNYDIILLENFPCNNKDELRARERFYIENNECVNKAIPGRTTKEWINDNKEKIAEYKKKHYQENKEKIAEQKKKYQLENKEKRREYEKKYRLDNKEKITEQTKKYRLDNKKIISEKKKKYQLENKEKIAEQRKVKITCSCGSIFRKNDKARHERTKKHQKFIQEQRA
jgi:hypothetical protein